MNADQYNPQKLDEFVSEWQKSYLQRVKLLELFNKDIAANLTFEQKKYFVKIFYHARGKFHDFLWYLGSNTQSSKVKKIVLENISEEFNGSAASHEEMYMYFAKQFDVDLSKEFLKNTYYIDSIRKFNENHIRYLIEHDDSYRIAAFSAYEKLDNIDYPVLLEFAKEIGVKGKGLIFFKVHAAVEHFEATQEILADVWEKNPEAVKNGFKFIENNQIYLWETLSKELKEHAKCQIH